MCNLQILFSDAATDKDAKVFIRALCLNPESICLFIPYKNTLFIALYLTAVRVILCASVFEFQLKGRTSDWTKSSAGSSAQGGDPETDLCVSACVCMCVSRGYCKEEQVICWCRSDEPLLICYLRSQGMKSCKQIIIQTEMTTEQI